MAELIERQAVIDVLKETGIIQDNDLGHLVVEEIERIPIAYDVEKVVEQLEERSKRGMKCDECINRTRVDDCTDICDRGAFAKAIEVVRNGGVE